LKTLSGAVKSTKSRQLPPGNRGERGPLDLSKKQKKRKKKVEKKKKGNGHHPWMTSQCDSDVEKAKSTEKDKNRTRKK